MTDLERCLQTGSNTRWFLQRKMGAGQGFQEFASGKREVPIQLRPGQALDIARNDGAGGSEILGFS